MIEPQPLTAPEPPVAAPAPAPDTWEGLLATLRARYPGQKDSVLFCLHKLQQNPELTLRDIRDEASLHGVPAAGRALHSAKVLLGLAEAKPRRPRIQVNAPSIAEAPATAAPVAVTAPRRTPERDPDLGARVLDAVEQLRSSASADADRLRAAIRDAITILQRALD